MSFMISLEHTIRLIFNLCTIFLGRHWALAIVNSLFTAGIGLLLIRITQVIPKIRLSTASYLHLRYFLFLMVLCKGTFYMIVGDNRQLDHRFAAGFQLPSYSNLIIPLQTDSVWHPTSATHSLTFLLMFFAFGLLLRRAFLVMRSNHYLLVLAQMQQSNSNPRLDAAWMRAINALNLSCNTKRSPLMAKLYAAREGVIERLNLSSRKNLPTIISMPISHPTPLLLGIKSTKLLFPAYLVDVLTDAELEMALRHELAHYIRRDHWWRWALVWVEDLGKLNPFAKRLSASVIDQEEQLCDRLAVRSKQDASILACAITKVSQISLQAIAGGSPSLILPDKVVPALLGNSASHSQQRTHINQRLHNLLTIAQERPQIPWAQWISFGCLFSLLAGICYLKFYVLIGPPFVATDHLITSLTHISFKLY